MPDTLIIIVLFFGRLVAVEFDKLRVVCNDCEEPRELSQYLRSPRCAVGGPSRRTKTVIDSVLGKYYNGIKSVIDIILRERYRSYVWYFNELEEEGTNYLCIIDVKVLVVLSFRDDFHQQLRETGPVQVIPYFFCRIPVHDILVETVEEFDASFVRACVQFPQNLSSFAVILPEPVVRQVAGTKRHVRRSRFPSTVGCLHES